MNNKALLIVVVFFAELMGAAVACTIFTASFESIVLAANNEDMCTTNTQIHIIPPSEEKYGCIFWGFIGDKNYQGGMNEYGLFFDGAGTPPVEMTGWSLPEFKDRYILEVVLEKCKTVEEAIKLVSKYSLPYLRFCHILVADATGDAAVFEWGNNRINFLRKGDMDFLIATNFNLTESPDHQKECFRYAAAEKMLSENKPSLPLFERILSVTHAEGDFPTVYSNICDLKRQKMYLYNFHNYNYRHEFDLAAEFKKGEQKYLVRSLFPTTNAELIFRYRSDCIDSFEDLPVCKVTFRVKGPVLPEVGSLSIKGNAKEFGEWEGPGIKLEKLSEDIFEKSVSLKEGKLFDFVLVSENDEFFPVGINQQRLGEEIIDLKSDTVILIEVTGWNKQN